MCYNVFQSHQIDVSVFRHTSIHASHHPFLPHLLASLRQSRTEDLDLLQNFVWNREEIKKKRFNYLAMFSKLF